MGFHNFIFSFGPLDYKVLTKQISLTFLTDEIIYLHNANYVNCVYFFLFFFHIIEAVSYAPISFGLLCHMGLSAESLVMVLKFN